MDADPRDQRIRELEAEVARLRAENEPLRQLVKQLQERVEELQRAAARQAAPFRRKDKDRKPPGVTVDSRRRIRICWRSENRSVLACVTASL
jgi:predicted RNase H-like nuclease (RuvC/YqgF family)